MVAAHEQPVSTTTTTGHRPHPTPTDVRHLDADTVGDSIQVRRNGVPEVRRIVSAQALPGAFEFTLDNGRRHVLPHGCTVKLLREPGKAPVPLTVRPSRPYPKRRKPSTSSRLREPVHMAAADLCPNDLGSLIEFRTQGVIVYGELTELSSVAGMVSFTLDDQGFVVDEETPVVMSPWWMVDGF